jgi:hypothetical protein
VRALARADSDPPAGDTHADSDPAGGTPAELQRTQWSLFDGYRLLLWNVRWGAVLLQQRRRFLFDGCRLLRWTWSVRWGDVLVRCGGDVLPHFLFDGFRLLLWNVRRGDVLLRHHQRSLYDGYRLLLWSVLCWRVLRPHRRFLFGGCRLLLWSAVRWGDVSVILQAVEEGPR